MASTDPDVLLARDMGRFFSDPLGFVMYAYPWDTDPALQVVRLPEPWALVYASDYGPDAWACEFLDRLGRQVREHGFDGRAPVPAIMEALSSGHGIGKSAMVAWLVCWIMSTRPYAHGTVTATTSDQLSGKTWAEIAKWNKRSITGHWFDVTTGKGAMRMMHKQHRESWFCAAQTCREENSEAFAGQHAANSTSFYIFDEASGVPKAIWEVSNGGMTDGEPMWFAFGNPTRNTGAFADCFGAQRHRWNNTHIDSRSVAITNKALISEWIADYGEQSDFVKVRVRGVFPSASSLQFISRDLVDEAMGREVTNRHTVGKNAVVGVDVARFGGDSSVIATRVGRDGASIAAKRYTGVDLMQLAARVVEHINGLSRAGLKPTVFVDGGGVGGGVVDRLRQLNVDVVEVQFGGKADDPVRYANKSAEMWARAKEWLKSGSLSKSETLATDLTNREYQYKDGGQLQLEKKEDMKRRGLASPDEGDAFALTFAHPVADHVRGQEYSHTQPKRKEHDPYA